MKANIKERREMKAITTIAVLVIMVMMSGTTVAEGDQIYGTMSRNCSECAECTDVMDAMENLPFAQFDAMSAEATATSSGITIEKKWAYGRRNVAPEGIIHVYYDFEEGMNLYPFKNAHPGVASFETVDVPGCYGDNEPSYVVKCANCGPIGRCVMHIYPCNTRYDNGTPLPYIHIVNGDAAFSPRALASWQGYYPACRAFIGFKDGTNYVSFLASTGGNLYVRAYDKQGNYLGGTTIYYTTDRVGDGPSNFTRFTMHLPGVAIGYMTFSGPFNGWHIDDLIVGDTPGYLPDEGRRNYDWAADRMKTLVGAKYHDLGLGYILETGTYLTADEIINDEYPIWNPLTNEMLLEEGICPEAAIVWAFNEHENLVNNLYANDQRKRDFKEEIAYEDVQPGDVYFIDLPPADGIVDEVGMFVDTGTPGDIVRVKPTEGVCYDSSQWMEDMRISEPTAIVDYRSLPDIPRGPKSPYPKPPREPKI